MAAAERLFSHTAAPYLKHNDVGQATASTSSVNQRGGFLLCSVTHFEYHMQDVITISPCWRSANTESTRAQDDCT